MPGSPDQILTVAQMVAAEQALIAGGETVDSLMQTAGRGAAEWVWRLSAGRPVTVLCGPGNNGGDGYVIAETLRARGLPVSLVALCDPATDAARNVRGAYAGDVLGPDAQPHGAVLVDCLFGSGLARPLAADTCRLLATLAASHPHRVAVDLPSGVESDTGRPLNRDLPDYHLTLALGAWKHAHWLMPASAMMGERRLVPIGVAPVAGAAQLIARPHLNAPAADAHKYARGLAVVVGGAMPGAALLASQAAMRGGAGYVKLFADGSHPDAGAELVIDHDPLETALDDPRINAVLIGPGLGRDAAARERLGQVLARDCPAVLDADALVLLRPEMLAGRTAPTIATPHEGELERLALSFGIEEDGKLATARALAQASGMAVVAKGPDTIVAAPDGRIGLTRPAPSWLSVAGTGDVLAGLAVSRLATGAEPFAAACEAVWLHGSAARLAGPLFTSGELARHVRTAYGACL